MIGKTVAPLAAPALRPAPGPAAKGPASAPGRDFGAVLQEVASGAVRTMETSEAVAMEAIQGRADLQQVVDRVMEAERTLAAAMAIRNKLIAAWQEISRMQI